MREGFVGLGFRVWGPALSGIALPSPPRRLACAEVNLSKSLSMLTTEGGTFSLASKRNQSSLRGTASNALCRSAKSKKSGSSSGDGAGRAGCERRQDSTKRRTKNVASAVPRPFRKPTADHVHHSSQQSLMSESGYEPPIGHLEPS